MAFQSVVLKNNNPNKFNILKNPDTPILHNAQIYQNIQDYEQYAYVYSKVLSERVFDDDDDLSIDQYVKITNVDTGKAIYRKCAAKNGIKKEEISLGNRSLRELGIKIPSPHSVIVRKSNWFSYMWHNSDASFRFTFYFTLLALACSIISLLVDLI